VNQTLARGAAYVSQLGAAPDDDDETRLKRTILIGATLLITVAGFVWGLIYAAGGEPRSAVIPFGYTLLSVINLGVLARTGRIDVFRPIQILMTLLLPWLLMLALGGFVPGSAVILWAFLAPLGALMCWGTGRAVQWFGAYITLVAVSGALNPWLRHENNLAPWLNTLFFVFNTAAVSSVAFGLLYYFVGQKNLAVELAREKRDLEQANAEQERMLRQSERLATLGRLSAGVAHELNNPAAAVQRGAAQLANAIEQLEDARFRLGQLTHTDSQQAAVEELHHLALDGADRPVTLSALERSDREAALEESLHRSGVREAWDIAPTLVELGYERATIDDLAGRFAGPELEAALASLTGSTVAHRMLREIGDSAGRITEIVKALKTYTYMDQSPVQFLDVNEGLDNTLVMLRGKLKRGVDVERDYAFDLPPVQGNGGELNQVWTNIIDNAIDAMEGEGTLRIKTREHDGCVTVTITDDGPGIPAEVVAHIFDPFFTTKPLGEGTGLGLNISHNIVAQKHHGEITVESRPGATSFIVRLPVRQEPVPEAAGDGAPSAAE
jgi:signal transduction histidine kinase